jgi:hypothetical protein
LELISGDRLHDLAPATDRIEGIPTLPTPDEQKQVENWLKVKVQLPLINAENQCRQRELQIRQDYLQQAMESAIKDAQRTQMKLAAKVAGGDETYRVARDKAQNKVRSLQERYQNKLQELNYLKIIRPGRVSYLGTALVCPAPVEVASPGMRNDPEVEAFAMQYVMDYERARGWMPEDVSQKQDGSGFDIRSVGPEDPVTQIAPVRRIEVKGRAFSNEEISLTANEWRKAQQLGESYWLYVVWGTKTESPQLLKIQNPACVLAAQAKEIKQVTRYLVGAEALQENTIKNEE